MFRPNNSIVFLYDHITNDGLNHLKDTLSETKKYYRFQSFSALCSEANPKKRLGHAVICFKHARKSVFLRAVPYLLDEGISFTIFLDPECIGLNRLPWQEEISLYRDHFQGASKTSHWDALQREIWGSHDKLSIHRTQMRDEFGTLPIPALDPTRFMATWGEILKVSSSNLLDTGFFLSFEPNAANRVTLEKSKKFVETLTKKSLLSAYLPTIDAGSTSTHPNESTLEAWGGILTPKHGAVTPLTSMRDVPCWETHE